MVAWAGFLIQWSEAMKSVAKAAVATSAAVCAALFSFNWSEQQGVSLSVESAQARVGRPLTPVSVAGVARRQDRRAARGYGGYGGYGYGLAGAAAVGTAAAVAGSRYYGGPGYYGGDPYYRPGVWGARAAYYGPAPAASTDAPAPAWNLTTAYYSGGPWYGYGGWDDYRTRNSIVCTPGTWIKGADGVQYPCQ